MPCVQLLQPHPTLCDPMDCSPPGYSIHGILQARILERVSMPPSTGSSWPRDRTHISCIFHIIGIFFTAEPLGRCTYITYVHSRLFVLLQRPWLFWSPNSDVVLIIHRFLKMKLEIPELFPVPLMCWGNLSIGRLNSLGLKSSLAMSPFQLRSPYIVIVPPSLENEVLRGRSHAVFLSPQCLIECLTHRRCIV